jgi:NAD(P)-dependent dehydrogenase (short-subunit alcohol dehydrogenase family)
MASPDRPADSTSARYKMTIDLIPLGRVSQPEDMVGLCVFLASDASTYLTGQDILIDDGWSLVMRPMSMP